MGRFPRERIWPTIVVTALAANVALGITLARIANDDPSFAVEPDYYAKAIAWDSVQAQRERNSDLGWWVVPTLTAVTAGASPSLTLSLRDRDDRPVRGALVSLEAMQVANASRVIAATLADPDGTGDYRAPVAVDRTGLWEFRITAVRDGERFTTNLRLEASPTGIAAVVTARPGDPPPPASGT